MARHTYRDSSGRFARKPRFVVTLGIFNAAAIFALCGIGAAIITMAG